MGKDKEMDRKEISAFLANCKASEMMAYADLGDGGTVVVADDGKKYRYSNDQLEKAEAARSEAHAPKPKPKPASKAKPPSKAKPRKKPATKTGSKPQ